MHAVVVNVTINDPEAAERALREQLVPRVSQLPAFVTGRVPLLALDETANTQVHHRRGVGAAPDPKMRTPL